MLKIKATSGHEFIVDDQDQFVQQYRWNARVKGRNIYINRKAKIKDNLVTIYLHREILNAQPGQIVDHIDGDTLNNRRSNLRLASYSQNGANSTKRRANTSGYKGVTWDKHRKKWMAAIRVNYKRMYLGRFNTKEEAAKAYNDAAKLHFGEFALLNEIVDG